MTFVITNRHASGLNQLPSGPPKLNPHSRQADGLVAWWPGYIDVGETAVRDYTGRGNHATWTTAANGPQIGSAFNNRVQRNDDTNDAPIGDAVIPELQGATELTLLIWYRRTNTSQYAGIGYGHNSSNRIHIAPWTTGAIFLTIGGNFNSTSNYNDVLWHFAALVFDGALATTNRLRGYIDGALEVSTTTSTASFTSHASNRIRLGHPVGGSGTSNDAEWFDARAYNRALSAAEISDQYHRARWDLWDMSNRTYFIPAAAPPTGARPQNPFRHVFVGPFGGPI